MKTFTNTILSFAFVVVLVFQSKADTHIVSQSEFTFLPTQFECNVGDIIRWEWTSGIHNTTSLTVPSGAASWGSALDAETPFFEYVVTVQGEYVYNCSFHIGMGMMGDFLAGGTVDVASVLIPVKDMIVGVEIGAKNLHIHFDGGIGERGAIRIYDLTGKLVTTIFEGNLSNEDMEYDASSLERGIYFVRFEAGSKIITRKIMLE